MKLGVCSTSNENAVRTIVEVLLGPKVAAATTIFAGDVVPAKKPDPAIYTLAAETLDVNVARYSPCSCTCCSHDVEYIYFCVSLVRANTIPRYT